MITNVEKYIDILEEFDINEEQFLFCYLLATRNIKLIEKHFIRKNRMFKRGVLDKMVISGAIIIKNYSKDQKGLTLANIQVTEKFKDKIIVDIEKAAKEIYEAYFDHGYANGARWPARDIIFEDFVELYGKRIKNNIEEHERILRITKLYRKTRQFAETGLKKYIGTFAYNTIEAEISPKKTKKYGEKFI